MRPEPTREPGMFALVLHSHLPWLANHGRWPVGEEWLYQSWAATYLPVVDVLRRLTDEGHTRLLTLGITPVLAAQLDDPHSLTGMHHWLGNWKLRAHEAAGMAEPSYRALGAREHRAADWALESFETRWRHGGSPVIRELIDADTIELLGGPLAHPFQPLLDPRLRAFSLSEGLEDAHQRWHHTPRGIWGPECGFTPGMEKGYAAAGVEHFMVDGPALHGDTALGRTVRESDVVCFGRDLQVSYRVWSPKSGYPGHSAYRDFHTYCHDTGLKPSRVTGRTVASEDKAPYDPDLASAALDRHVEDFVDTVRKRLRNESARIGRDALVVAAFDTELFGHWCTRDRSSSNDCCVHCPKPGSRSARSPTHAIADTSADRWTSRTRPGDRGRTGGCGPVTRSPIWSSSTTRWSPPLSTPSTSPATRSGRTPRTYATGCTTRFCVKH